MTKRTTAADAATVTAGDPSPVDLPVVPSGAAELLPEVGQLPGEQTASGIPGLVGRDAAVSPTGFTIRCGRPQGIWRAGRFWPPESVSVPASELTVEQLERLLNEPLLAITPYVELVEE